MKRVRKRSGNIAQKYAADQSKVDLLPIEEIKAGYTPQFQDFLAQLAEIAGKINVVEMVTATNYAAERDKWLEQAQQGKFTTPQLRYNRDLLREIYSYHRYLVQKLEPQSQRVKAELPDNAIGYALGHLLNTRLQDVIRVADLAGAMLNGEGMAAANCVTYIYGAPTNDNIRQAGQAVQERKAGKVLRSKQTFLTDAGREQLSAMKLDAEAVRQIFIWAAEQYGFAATRPVVVSEQATALDVRDVSSQGPIVVIPADYQATGFSIIPLVVHEVGCHWRDSENMQQLLPLLGAGALKPMDELLYEGHAVDQETAATLQLQSTVQFRRQLYYPIAIGMARQKYYLFNETAKELFATIRSERDPLEQTLDDVWRVTYRVYRGNPRLDVRNGYAYTKDRAYFGGQVLARELRQTGMGYLLDYGTLTLSDLNLLTPRFNLRPQNGMPYPDQEDLAKQLCEELLRGKFTHG